MRRPLRYLPGLLFCVAVSAPLFGCDIFKPKEMKADTDGSVAVAPPAPADPAAPPTTAATTTAPPLNPATPTGPGPAVQPTAKTDGGAVADSGAKSDAATPSTPPPFPGIDASALQSFDAGGLFKVPDGGFKPPWQK